MKKKYIPSQRGILMTKFLYSFLRFDKSNIEKIYQVSLYLYNLKKFMPEELAQKENITSLKSLTEKELETVITYCAELLNLKINIKKG